MVAVQIDSDALGDGVEIYDSRLPDGRRVRIAAWIAPDDVNLKSAGKRLQMACWNWIYRNGKPKAGIG